MKVFNFKIVVTTRTGARFSIHGCGKQADLDSWVRDIRDAETDDGQVKYPAFSVLVG